MSMQKCPECGATITTPVTVDGEQLMKTLWTLKPPRPTPLPNPVVPARAAREVLRDWYDEIKPALPWVMTGVWMVVLLVLTLGSRS